MATGKKLRNSQVMDGRSFMDDYNIALEAAEKLENVLHITGNGNDKILAFYVSEDATDLTDYAGFPKGTIIEDSQAHITHEKTAAEGTSAWVSSVARS